MSTTQKKSPPATGLGLDAGGSQTRWALADADGAIIAEGHVGGMSGLLMATAAGREQIKTNLADIARAVSTICVDSPPERVYAGMTGFDEDGRAIAALIGAALAIESANIVISNDIEIAYHDCFAPGAGYVVYAGTGSVAAFIDTSGELHRAGGRGALLDDAGGGYWIAREALRHIWREEDQAPGAWRTSPMAVALFEKIGGSDWAMTRKFVYEGNRGDIGKLALAVAATAEQDQVAMTILRAAGDELARLAHAMIARFGPRPIALTGRAMQLHSVIEISFRAALANMRVTGGNPPSIALKISQPHVAAARIAASRRT